MNPVKGKKVRTIKGRELRVQRERLSEFWAYERKDGTFAQASTRRKGVTCVKVTSVLTTFVETIPGTNDRDLVEQTIVGPTEACEKYLTPKIKSLSVEHTDTGCKTEWTF